MTTSLAQQLKKYQLPQTSLLVQDKKKASLLFDPKEAAALKRETVYQIGIDGLEELISKNPVFEQFRNTLFDITSKEVSRSVQSKDFNQKLDKEIRRFLILLSPYFLLNSAHKALEWLIRRFSINEYNRDDMLMLILPYHETNIFIRTLQLLKINDTNDDFFFLKPLQKPGLHLTKQALLNHASTSPCFLKFVSDFVILMLKFHEKPSQLTVIFNFYCTVFTGSLEYSDKVNENQISQMLPSLLKGLSSKIPDFCAASYVIVARLSAKIDLSEKILDKFVVKLSRVKVDSLRTEALLALLIVYQSQKHYTKLPQEAVYNFAEQKWLPKVLQDLNAQGSYIYPLLEQIIKSIVETVRESDKDTLKDFLKNILSHLKLDGCFIGTLINILLDSMKIKAEHSKKFKAWLRETLDLIEKQYPDCFDKEIYKILSEKDDQITEERKKFLKTLIFKTTFHKKAKFELFQKLHHPNPHVRLEAIKFISQKSTMMNKIDSDMIKSSFVERLCDDDVEVINGALDVIKAIPDIDMHELKDKLKILALKCERMHEFKILSAKVLKLLCSISGSDDIEMYAIFLSYFIYHSIGDINTLLKNISDTSFAKENHLIKIDDLVLCRTNDEVLSVFLKNLNENTTSAIFRKLVKINEVKLHDDDDTFYKCLVLIIISHIVPQGFTIEDSASLTDVLFKWLNVSSLHHQTVEEVEEYQGVLNHKKYLSLLDDTKEGKFHFKCLLLCLEKILLQTNIPQVSINVMDYSQHSYTIEFFVAVSNILFTIYETNPHYCETFFGKFCPNFKSKIEFLLNISVSNNVNLNPTFQENAIKMLSAIVCSEKDFDTIFVHDSLIVPYLLMFLLSDKELVRAECLQFINKALDSCKKRQGTYWSLVNAIRKHKEEVLLDNQQIPLIMFNLLSPETTKNHEKDMECKENLNTLIKVCCNEESPIYLKSGLMNLLMFINSIEIFEKFSVIALKLLEEGKKEYSLYESSIIERTISRLDVSVVANIELESNIAKFIEIALKDDKSVIECDGKKLCPCVIVLNQIDKELFINFTEALQIKLLDLITEVSTLTQNPMVLPSASQIFKHIDLDVRLIVHNLNKMLNVQSSKQEESIRRRRTNILPTVDILDALEWRRGVTILEFIQDKKKVRNTEQLLPLLFDILKRCLDFDEQVAVEYPKQLLLSSILNCCLKLKEQSLPESVFNMELVVQCIRASLNPQTHHHALLVLTETASLFPSQVLHHIMAIFTFMGSSVLRHDDSYSFQILTRIIDEVIPILVGDNCLDKIGQVLRVFVDAMLDVPEHRRIPLYRLLLTKIQARDNLYLFLLLVFETHVKRSSKEKQNTNEDNIPRLLDVAANLCREFSPEVVIHTCLKLIQYLKTLPDEKEDIMETESDDVTFNIQNHTPKEFRHYKYTLVLFISSFLSSKEFVNQIAQMNDEELLNMEPLYKDMIINVLIYVQRTSKTAERNISTAQAQYWKVILHHSYDILDSINALLTPEMFLLVIKGLTVHNLGMVRRRALDLLNSKLQYNSSFFTNCDDTDVFSIVPSLLSIIETVNDDIDTEQETIAQTALLSLKLLVKLLGANNGLEFKKILEFIVRLIKSGKAKGNVLASVVLCLAELCANLGAHAIPDLPHYMPVIIKILKQQKHQDPPSLLLFSVLTALYKIFENLSLFMSPYLVKILCELCVLMSKYGTDVDDQRTNPVVTKLISIKQKIGLSVPPRVLIPAINQCYVALSDKNCFNSVGSLMDILAESLSHLKGPDINSHLPELTNFFLTALQFRADSNASLEEANIVEKHIIKALTTLVLKLSESSFRPLYYKLYNWAVQNEEKSERVITYYNLSSDISENLKGLFVLFSGHFINHAAQILDACNQIKNEELYFEAEEKNILLLETVLKTLCNIFLYDSQKFVNKDRFDALMQPIVDQLENTLGGTGELEKRAKDLIIPCIVAFTVAIADDSLWKLLNYQILLKMRHNSPEIRMIALQCLTETVKKLGDDFLPLLPETIPFLAELLEDEEEQVEKACQKSVQEMEKVLGESLQKYF